MGQLQHPGDDHQKWASPIASNRPTIERLLLDAEISQAESEREQDREYDQGQDIATGQP